MHARPAGCMRAKLSLTSAYPKLGYSHTKNNYCKFMTIKLSQLMLNLNSPTRAGLFSRYAVDMHSQCKYYDLYVQNQRSIRTSQL